MLSVAVLGANGFFGSRLVEVLHLTREHRVVPIAHSISGLARIARFDIDWRVADATDAQALTVALSGCDIVVHAIAGSLESIVKSPHATLQACKAAGVRRVVYLSTASVHGQDPDPGTDESSPLHTRHLVPYNNAKVISERAFLAQHAAFGVQLVVLRPGIVFGPRDVWITGIARSIVDGSAALVGGGDGWCNTIYVDNLVQAVRCAITTEANGGVFLVGDAQTITWRELYQRVADVLGHRRPIRSVPAPPLKRGGFDAIDAIKAIPGVQTLLDHTPAAPKLWARRHLEAAARVQRAVRGAYNNPAADPWRGRSKPTPEVSIETALLHHCRQRFSYDKARVGLGYTPPYSLNEALEFSAAWLEFIGYPPTARDLGHLQHAESGSASPADRD
jgi:nucleoside-diphosphate-sugar epimerase